MENRVYFENVPRFGDLFLEKILFEDECPIFFILRNSNYTQRFIGVCCDITKEQRWVIVTISEEKIIDLLSDKITIREAFENENATYIIAVWRTEYEKEEYRLCKLSDVPINDLPTGDVYFKSRPLFADYIAFLFEDLMFNYNNCFYEDFFGNYLGSGFNEKSQYHTVIRKLSYKLVYDLGYSEPFLEGIPI